MMMLQKKSKRRILMCLSTIGALVLASAFVFIGCEDAANTNSTTLNAPTNLNANAGNGAVTLSWAASTGGAAVTQYYIYRATGTDISSATRLSPTTPAMIAGTTYTDLTADNDTEYIYAVRAVTANGTESGNSNTATATPRAPEGVPNSLTATAGDSRVPLKWTPPAGDVTVASYRIYRATGDGAFLFLIPLNSSARTYIDRAVNNGTTYRYVVRAVDGSDVESADSEIAPATPLAAPNAPTALTASDGDSSVTLSWTAPTDGTEVTQYYIYRAEGSSISGATRVTKTPSEVITGTTYTDSGLTNNTEYTYEVRSVNTNGTESVNNPTVSATPRLVPRNVMAVGGGTEVTLSWSAVTGATEYYILRTIAGGSETRLTTPLMLTETTYTDSNVIPGITYRYRIQAIFGETEGEISDSQSATPSNIDSDNDTLIDINNLDMLNNIRHNLSGSSYRPSAGGSEIQCGMSGTTACTGYELMRDLDFAAASSYASGSVNMAWRPTGGTPDSATNSGWQPIGNNTTPFAALFEGNGRSISNLYSRNAADTHTARTGLFGQMNASGTLRNLLIADSNVYGGLMDDFIGIAVGRNSGTITNVAVRGGSAHGNTGTDNIGGLAGWSDNAIIASSSTANVDGDGGATDSVGGLVGRVNGGSVTASYATGVVDGGAGSFDQVGGLVGDASGTIRASYARGNVNANSDQSDAAGGLVGNLNAGATIIAGYATGNADGGAGASDSVGKLNGKNSGTTTASYGFGTTSGGEATGSDGSALPAGATMATQLTMPVATNPPTTAVPAEWQDAASHTLNAWDFGNNTQTPALRYADYDGDGGTDYCASFGNVPGTTTPIVCGTTLLSGQR